MVEKKRKNRESRRGGTVGFGSLSWPKLSGRRQRSWRNRSLRLEDWRTGGLRLGGLHGCTMHDARARASGRATLFRWQSKARQPKQQTKKMLREATRSCAREAAVGRARASSHKTGRCEAEPWRPEKEQSVIVWRQALSFFPCTAARAFRRAGDGAVGLLFDDRAWERARV